MGGLFERGAYSGGDFKMFVVVGHILVEKSLLVNYFGTSNKIF